MDFLPCSLNRQTAVWFYNLIFFGLNIFALNQVDNILCSCILICGLRAIWRSGQNSWNLKEKVVAVFPSVMTALVVGLRNRSSKHKLKHRSFLLNIRKLWEGLHVGTSCPGRCWSLPCWRHSSGHSAEQPALVVQLERGGWTGWLPPVVFFTADLFP